MKYIDTSGKIKKKKYLHTSLSVGLDRLENENDSRFVYKKLLPQTVSSLCNYKVIIWSRMESKHSSEGIRIMLRTLRNDVIA